MTGAYYHNLFVRGRPILSTMIKRIKIKGVKALQDEMVEIAVPRPTTSTFPEDEEEEDGVTSEEEKDEIVDTVTASKTKDANLNEEITIAVAE